MNNLVRDTPATPSTETLPARLRAAREAKGLSRAQLAKLTDIPLKAIEKFEVDDQEPSASRLLKLCKVLGTTMEEILGLAPGTGSPALTLPPAQMQSAPALADAENEDSARSLLDEIDYLRASRFKRKLRTAIAHIDDLRRELKFYEPDELLDLAQDREVNTTTGPGLIEIMNAMASNFDEGQKLCSEIEERIIDTAVLGVDLLAVEHGKLKVAATVAAKAFRLEVPFFGWGTPQEIVQVVREPLRRLALAGKGIELTV